LAASRWKCADEVSKGTLHKQHVMKTHIAGASDPKISISKPVKGYTTKIIQRDRLSSCLLKVLRERYPQSATVRHPISKLNSNSHPVGSLSIPVYP